MTQRLGRYSGGGNANPLQYSCLENSMDSGAWWATVHGVAKESDMAECTSLPTPPTSHTQRSQAVRNSTQAIVTAGDLQGGDLI